jgi:hypothetical protein
MAIVEAPFEPFAVPVAIAIASHVAVTALVMLVTFVPLVPFVTVFLASATARPGRLVGESRRGSKGR